MSFRPYAAACILATAACTGEVSVGPAQVRDRAFAYTSAMPAGDTLVLRNMVGSLRIEPSPDDSLRVVAALHWYGGETPPTEVSFRGSPIAGGVLVCAVFGEGRCSRDDYDGKSDGSGFSISRRGIRLGLGGSSRASAHFTVQVPAGVPLDLVLVEGDVTSASSAPVRVRGVNGTLTVVTSVGPVIAKMVNGNVDVRMTTLGGSDSVMVETVNGDVFAFLPELAAATVDVRTTNGTVLSDFAGVAGGSERFNKTISGVLGAGTTPVRVRSVNGDAQLRRLDAQGRAYDLAPPATP